MYERVKNAYNKAKLLNDISIREQIIQNYHQTGYLDRDEVIKKILELRCSDAQVAEITAIQQLSTGFHPFSQATDQEIIYELQMQISILSKELNDIKYNY